MAKQDSDWYRLDVPGGVATELSRLAHEQGVAVLRQPGQRRGLITIEVEAEPETAEALSLASRRRLLDRKAKRVGCVRGRRGFLRAERPRVREVIVLEGVPDNGMTDAEYEANWHLIGDPPVEAEEGEA